MVSQKTAILVGVCDKKGSTNIPMVKSLVKLGLNVIPVNYRTILSNKNMKFLEEYIIYLCRQYSPLITIFSKCNGVSSDIISRCNNYTRTFLFNMDPRKTIESCPEVLEHAVRANYSSCTAIDLVEWFNDSGANCTYIPQGVDIEVFRPVESCKEYEADISFIGSATKERTMYIERLRGEGFNVKAYGQGYSPTEVIDKEFCRVCCSSNMMLSLNTFNEHRQYFSNRLPRMMACGSCCFHIDPFDDVGNTFKDGEEIILFKNIEDLLLKIKSMTPEKIKSIGLRAADKIRKDLTWDSVIAYLLIVSGILKEKHE